MTGYKQPPENGRFKKGQSGNPMGRPKRTNTSLTQSAKATLDAASRMVTIREDGEARRAKRLEAVMLAQYKTALGGSAHAQRDIIQRTHAAEMEHRAQIEDENEAWEQLVAKLRFTRAEAAARGEEPPVPFPHPDDVIIDAERGVRFVGPLDAEDETRLQKTLKIRNLLFVQDAFDRRSWGSSNDEDVDAGPGMAALFAHTLNANVPKRHQLSDFDLMMLMMRPGRMTKREFAKMLYQSWRALGFEYPHGMVFPSMGRGKQVLTMMYEILSGKYDEAA